MEQYIDEFGNLQFKEVGTNYPFKSMSEMAAENALAINSQFLTPPDTLTSLPNFQDNYYLPSSNVITPKKFEEPFIMSGGQKVYISDTLGMQQAQEKSNVFEQPQGILSQAKDFITQKLPRTLKGGLDTLVNFIPGMRFIKSLDKFEIEAVKPEKLFIKGLSSFLSESDKLNVKIVNKDVVLFKSIDKEKNYSESAIIDRKSGELIHEITRNIKSENSEKDISFYSCSKKEKKV